MWKTLHSGLGLAVALGLFFGINAASDAALKGVRIDLTENKLFTLDRGTLNILADLESPIVLRFYYSKKVAEDKDLKDVQSYAERVQELLEEYVMRSHGKIELRVIDPEPFSEDEDRAVGYGLQGVPVDAAGQLFYFGLVGTNEVGDEEVIPFFQNDRESFLEYDITKLVYSLAHPEKPVVGLITALPLEGGPANPFQPNQRNQPWMVMDALRQLFQVRKLETTVDEIPEDIGILLLVHPKGLSDATLYAIDQFVLRGGKLIAFIDPHCEEDPVQQDPNNPLASATADRSSDLGPLMKAWGVEMDANKLVADRKLAHRVQFRGQVMEYVVWLGLKGEQCSDDDPITSELDELNFALAGALKHTEGAATTFTPLVQTTDEAMLVDRFMVSLGPDPERLLQEYVPGGEPLTLVARIGGPVKTAFPDGPPPKPANPEGDEESADEELPAHLAESQGDIHVLLVSDADMLADRWWVRVQNFFGQRIATPSSDNVDLLVNALDNLSGNSDLISLRSRGRYQRPFDRVAELRRQAEDRYRAEEQRLEAKLEETEQRINELQSQKEGGVASLILSPEQRAEIEAFRQEQKETRKKLREVRHQLSKEIENLGSWLKWTNMLGMPLLWLAAGIAVFALRESRKSS